MLYYGMKAWQADHSSKESTAEDVHEPDQNSLSVTETQDAVDPIEVTQSDPPYVPSEATRSDPSYVPNEATCDYYAAYIHQDQDMTTLDIIDGFLHDGSQVVLQIYVIAYCDPCAPLATTTIEPTTLFPNDTATDMSAIRVSHCTDNSIEVHNQRTMSYISAVVSLVILSWSFAKYVRAQRLNNSDKKKISLLGMIGQFVWHVYTLIPRVTAMALFASAYEPRRLITVGICHWLVMSIWARWERSRPAPDLPNGIPLTLWEAICCLVLGYIHVFCFLKHRDEPTRVKYFLFYGLILVEDTVFLTLWYFHIQENGSCHIRLPEMALSTVLMLTLMYLVGVFYLLLYYNCCHPNGRRKRGPRWSMRRTSSSVIHPEQDVEEGERERGEGGNS